MKSNRTDFTAGADLPRYTRDGKVPFGFNLDGRRFEGIPEEFSPAGETRRIDADTVFSVITGKTPDGLLLRAECTEYTDYPVVSWVAYVTNCGKERSAVVSGLSVDVSLSANGAVLEHGNGDTLNYEGYTWYKDAVGPDGFEISPCGDGTSCNGAFPYMRFLLDGRCVNAAVGWTGTWSLKTSARDGRLDISVSQKRFNTYLEPGETVRTPMLVLQACQGGEDRARNLWRGWYFRHVLPDEDGAKLQPKLVLHTFGINNVPEFCGITVENQLRGIRSYVKRGLRPDVWWIDAGWYPCDNKWYEGAGSWYFNPETLPDGIGAVGRQAEDLGIDLLLWFEPERVYSGSEIWREHEDFIIRRGPDDKNALLYLGNPEARRWITDRVDSIIKDARVRIYRQDFNFAPAGYWETGESDDRQGIHENLHIQGLYAFWDELARRNPGLLFDNCASGGRRNDFELMRRSVPFHYTDIGYGHHPTKQKQHRQMFEWIPYFRAHTMNWDNEDGSYGGKRPVDEFAYQNAMTPAVTSMIEWDDSDELFELGIRFRRIWRRAADMMLRADFYPLTETRADPSDWYAEQFYDPDADDGYIHVIRNIAAEEDKKTFRLYVPEENYGRQYVFTEASDGRTLTVGGAELASGGFTESIPKRSGSVWFYRVM